MTYQSTGRGVWAEPAVELVAPGVHRIPLPLPNDGLRAVNVYVLSGREAAIAIDSGWSIDEARVLLVRQLGTLDLGPADIRRFLVTHVHRDHYTLGVALRREFGNRVELGHGERASIEQLNDPAWKPMGRQLQMLRMMGAGELAERIEAHFALQQPKRERDFDPPDAWLSNGVLETEVGRPLEVVETPGHTQGHVVFHDPANSLLFAGDHVLPTITPSIGLEPTLSPNPLGQFLNSLALIRSRPDARLLPAHGPVAESAHARIDELVDHHGRRLDATLAALGQGATTGYESARLLSWTRRETAFAELDEFNAMLAISETGAHLQLLLAQGRIAMTEVDGVRHYTIV